MTSPNLDQERVERAAEAVYREFENRPKVARLQMNGVMADELARAAITAYLGDTHVDGPSTTVYGQLLFRHMQAARTDFDGPERKRLFELIERFRAEFPAECKIWDDRYATPTVNGKGE